MHVLAVFNSIGSKEYLSRFDRAFGDHSYHLLADSGILVVKGPIGACSLCTSVLLSRKSVM
jgi:hypothetical protein